MHSKGKLKHLFLLFVVFLSGCTGANLTVQTEYLSHENLASYIVKTPDPLLNNPPIGQRLIITWSVPRYFLSYQDLHLLIKIRFRNREQIDKKVCIKHTRGMHIFSLLNDDYFEKDGIETYKVELISNDEILEEWRHQLWVELITFDKSSA